MHTNPSTSHGFTLIELMIVLAVAAILAMLGAPAMGNLLARTRDAAAEVAMAGSLRHARTAAVMMKTRVVVCPSHDGRHCRPGDDWQHGWLIAPDANHDSQPDAGAQVIGTSPAVPGGTRIITSAGRRLIAFHANGNAAGSNVRFTICHVRERGGKSVVVANSGRVRVGPPEPDRLQQCLAGVP